MHTQMHLTGKLAERGFKSLNVARSGPYKTSRTWFVLADGEQAVILQRAKDGLERIGHALRDIEYEKVESNSAFGQRAPGGGTVMGRHGYGSSEDSLQHEDQLFARSLSDWLEKAANEDAYDALVIAASPKMLGYLRLFLAENTRDKVVAELNKDLVNQPQPQIERALAHIAYF